MIGGMPLITTPYDSSTQHKCRNKSKAYLHAAKLKTMPHPLTHITEGLNPLWTNFFKLYRRVDVTDCTSHNREGTNVHTYEDFARISCVRALSRALVLRVSEATLNSDVTKQNLASSEPFHCSLFAVTGRFLMPIVRTNWRLDFK